MFKSIKIRWNIFTFLYKYRKCCSTEEINIIDHCTRYSRYNGFDLRAGFIYTIMGLIYYCKKHNVRSAIQLPDCLYDYIKDGK